MRKQGSKNDTLGVGAESTVILLQKFIDCGKVTNHVKKHLSINPQFMLPNEGTETTEFKPLPDKDEIDYGSFRVKLLKVETASDGKKRSVTMSYVNSRTGTPFIRGFNTTETPGRFGWYGDEMEGETSVTSVISGLERLTDQLGPETIQKLKEFLGLIGNTRGELSATLDRR